MPKSPKRIFAILAVCFLAVFLLRIVAQNVKDSLFSPTYEFYVLETYMPAQKKRYGQWPADLKGLPDYIKSQPHYNPNPAPLNYDEMCLSFHERNYLSMHILKSDDKSCTYVLHLRGYTHTYTAKISK